MKILKSILVTLLFVSIVSCGDNDEPSVPFTLTLENLTGTYNIQSLNIDIESTAAVTVSGITNQVPISKIKSIGDTFQVNFVLNADGTYSASGTYRVVSTITPVDSPSETSAEIISFTDSGTYTLNVANTSMNFISENDEFLEGDFNLSAFNENTFTIKQEVVEEDNPITSTINATMTFVRK